MKKVGFTIGKFAPFHKGHEYLIETALKDVDDFYVVIYDTPQFDIDIDTKEKWVKKKFDNKNVLIDNAQIMYFINQEGYLDKSSEKTLSDLENEINKISSFVGKENKVTNEIIDQLSQKKVENDIFKLIDYIGQKNSSDAMKILNDMLYEGESVFGIFSMIARQFKVIMQVRQLQIQGHTSKSIAERLKLHPFVVGKALKQTKNFSDEVIIDILNSILESDFKIKNGLVRDTLSIEMLISKYCKKGN